MVVVLVVLVVRRGVQKRVGRRWVSGPHTALTMCVHLTAP